jgi:hypothetical protein
MITNMRVSATNDHSDSGFATVDTEISTNKLTISTAEGTFMISIKSAFPLLECLRKILGEES